jgi:uncharacterized protein YaiI (UPF0178 family)
MSDKDYTVTVTFTREEAHAVLDILRRHTKANGYNGVFMERGGPSALHNKDLHAFANQLDKLLARSSEKRA